jgi:DNA-binding Lrp family transcriptional regulator
MSMDDVNLNIVSLLVDDNALSLSITEIWKKLRNRSGSLTYPRIHERLKKLEANNLIERTGKNQRHGAVHFRISTFGLITYYANNLSEDRRYLIRDKEHSNYGLLGIPTIDGKFDQVVKNLLGEFFEEETIDSIYKIRGFPMEDIAEYIHESCKTTIRTMSEIWSELDKYKHTELLPKIEIIKEYMEFLFETKRPFNKSFMKNIEMFRKEVEQNIKNYQDRENLETLSMIYLGAEIPSFKLKQLEKVGENRKEFLEESGIIEDPIFEGFSLCKPLKDIFFGLSLLREKLEYKINGLITMIISRIGLYVSLKAEDNSLESFEKVFEYEDSMFLINMFKDKKLYKFTKGIKENFDKGYNQFSWYQNYKMEI